ncbi:MAG: hypothetical protein IPG86_16315 [Chitinophagaceae bacterium]|nr:hypothetical protein [Chitinophagaceae bacterium]
MLPTFCPAGASNSGRIGIKSVLRLISTLIIQFVLPRWGIEQWSYQYQVSVSIILNINHPICFAPLGQVQKNGRHLLPTFCPAGASNSGRISIKSALRLFSTLIIQFVLPRWGKSKKRASLVTDILPRWGIFQMIVFFYRCFASLGHRRTSPF